ncbi:hypothetical protein [Staphylococcus shinii]|uniref:hypothetical protein n=1 Tax=Staphylococcus shinii TaxID=2912228 RepID=UPI003EE8AB0F
MEHKEGNLEIMINQFYDATANINKSITNMVKELEPGRYLSYEQIETMHFIHHNEKRRYRYISCSFDHTFS